MFTLTTQLLLVVVVVALIWLATTKRMEPGHFLAVAIFAIYLVGVANFVILPLRYDPVLAQAMGPVDVGRAIGLKLFFLPGGDTMSSDQLFYNVLLTVPFGLGLPFVRQMRLRTVVLVGVIFSVGVELTQLVADATSLAILGWSVDINDVFLNSSGVVIGVIAFGVASFLYRASIGRFRLNLGPFADFHETLMQPRKTRRDEAPVS